MEWDSKEQHKPKYSERRAFPINSVPFHLCELSINQSTYTGTVTLVLDNFIIFIYKIFLWSKKYDYFHFTRMARYKKKLPMLTV